MRQPFVPNFRPYTVPLEADQFTIDTNNIIDEYRQSTEAKIRSGLRNKLIAVLAKKWFIPQVRTSLREWP
jgi:hypothetical protein